MDNKENQTAESTQDSNSGAEQKKWLNLQAASHSAVFLAALGIWAAFDSWLIHSGLWIAKPFAALSAIAAGIITSHIIHEWCHFFGAVLSQSSYTIKKTISPLFFDFDYAANSTRQYLWLSAGGPIGNMLLVVGIVCFIPLDNLARDFLFATCVGNLVYVLVLEGPVSKRIIAGEAPLDALVSHFGQAAVFKKSFYCGFAAGVTTLLFI